ncbi:HAD family hydrolase [Aestuariivirga sp.]|uniref:HAD family hydrolase n=1 Tax=Aestuariivirga sp. TaxID=2650926 RepID=UPI00391C8CFF
MGDNARTAARIGKDLGLDVVMADVLPGQMAVKIKERQFQGLRVGMVGDDVNDAPALTQADIGFADWKSPAYWRQPIRAPVRPPRLNAARSALKHLN